MGWRCRASRFQIHGVAIKNWEVYLSYKRSPLRSRDPSPVPGSPVQSTSARMRSLHNIWLWKQVGIASKWNGGLLKTETHHLSGPHTDLLFQKLTYSGLWCRGSSLKSHREIQGETELTSFRTKVWGTGVRVALSGDASTGRRCHCIFVEQSSHPAGRCQSWTLHLPG